jgi:hypothetical protein
MTQAPVAVFKIPTESPQQARGKAGRARKAAAAHPKAATGAGRQVPRGARRAYGQPRGLQRAAVG